MTLWHFVEHPQLIYDNGKVNTTALIKHFPSLSVAFVQEQWTNFRRYDKNGDGTLDLAEVYFYKFVNNIRENKWHANIAKNAIVVQHSKNCSIQMA